MLFHRAENAIVALFHWAPFAIKPDASCTLRVTGNGMPGAIKEADGKPVAVKEIGTMGGIDAMPADWVTNVAKVHVTWKWLEDNGARGNGHGVARVGGAKGCK